MKHMSKNKLGVIDSKNVVSSWQPLSSDHVIRRMRIAYYSPLLVAVHPILMKFGMLTRILILRMATWPKIKISQIQNGGQTPSWKSFFGYISAVADIQPCHRHSQWSLRRPSMSAASCRSGRMAWRCTHTGSSVCRVGDESSPESSRSSDEVCSSSPRSQDVAVAFTTGYNRREAFRKFAQELSCSSPSCRVHGLATAMLVLGSERLMLWIWQIAVLAGRLYTCLYVFNICIRIIS